MICPNCGFQNAAGDEFCGSCGHFLAWNQAAPDSTGGQQGSTGANQGSQAGPPPPPPPNTGGYVYNSDGSVVPDSGPTGLSALAGQGQENVSSGLTQVVPPPGTYNPGINWPAGLQRCDTCGTANELSRTFCLNCGAKLKKAGTTTGTALAVAAARDQRRREYRMIGYALGGALLFIVFAAGAFIVLGGLNAAPPPHLPTAPSTFIAVNPGASSSAALTLPPSAAIPTNNPVTPVPSFLPLPTPVESLPDVTAVPATNPPSSVPPATLPPVGGFVCAPSTFNASAPGGWQIYQAKWGHNASADSLALMFNPSSSASTGSVGVNILPPDQVETTYGVAGPPSGSVAVVLAFNDAVSLTGPFGAQVGYKALQDFQISRKTGLVYVVIGANGSGCYGLASDAWSSGSTVSPQMVISLQRP